MPLTKLRSTAGGGMKITITVPPMPPIPEGYKWVGWDLHSEASQDLAEGIKAWLWDLSEGAEDVYALRAYAVNVNNPNDWVACSFDHLIGRWLGDDWLFAEPPADRSECTAVKMPDLRLAWEPSLN